MSSILHPPSSTKCHPSSILHQMSSIIHEIISIQFHKATKKTKLDQRRHPSSSILHGHSYYYSMGDGMRMEDGGGCKSLAEHLAVNKTMECKMVGYRNGIGIAKNSGSIWCSFNKPGLMLWRLDSCTTLN